MTNNIITRDFAGLDTTFPVRIIELDDQPWFAAKDVCKALGFTGYASEQTKRLQQDEVRQLRRDSLILNQTQAQTLFDHKAPSASLISESGLYKLIMRSDKPQARLFQDWVTRDVLPAIRKDGAYIMGEEKVATGEMSEDELVMKAMSILSSKVELNALTTFTPSTSRKKRRSKPRLSSISTLPGDTSQHPAGLPLAGRWRSPITKDIHPMKNTTKLVRLNLHLRPDHISRLTALASKIAERKGRETRLAEALEVALDAGLTWTDSDLLDCIRSDSEQPRWLALGPVIRTR